MTRAKNHHPETEPGKNLELAERNPGRWKIEPGNGAARYTGRGKRGGRHPAMDDDRDLAVALNEMAAGRALLADAYQIPTGVRRRAAIAEAVAKIALGTRFADDVVMRRGGRCLDVEPDGTMRSEP
jgi:hypothetical protein